MNVDTHKIAVSVVNQAPRDATKMHIAYEAAEQVFSEALNQTVELREAMIRIRDALFDEGYTYPSELIIECNTALGLNEDDEPQGSPDDLTEFDPDEGWL